MIYEANISPVRLKPGKSPHESKVRPKDCQMELAWEDRGATPNL
jgi:hypothetical protein